jgi:tripartite-type tricarboxylate transporter receptor subunit TctC
MSALKYFCRNSSGSDKPGAAGNIASDFVARARPDGHTLVLGTSGTHAINAALYRKMPFDVEADFTPVGTINDVSNVLTINPQGKVADANAASEGFFEMSRTMLLRRRLEPLPKHRSHFIHRNNNLMN